MKASPRMQEYTVPAGVNIGHVHLKVSNIDRALEFYHGILGFEIVERFGSEAAFISAGGYHHHIGLNTWESRDGDPPAPGTTGLYHLAIRYPDRKSLAIALRRVLEAGINLAGAADHGVSHSVYIQDPDGNGVELTVDLPKEKWLRDSQGNIRMVTRHLDLRSLLEEAKRVEVPLTS